MAVHRREGALISTMPIAGGVVRRERADVPHAEHRWWWRWLPCAAAIAAVVALLLASDTPIAEVGRYCAYAVLAVALPGTLVYRALRRRPHTFAEDVAMGTATGLALELAAWAAFSALDIRRAVWAWPLAVVIPFVAVPGLRRHWRVKDYPARPSLAWSWALAGIVVFFAGYLYAVFLSLNPIVPDTEVTEQFLDLPYQLSLAAQAKHNFPLDVPQVAGEPLHYHWFAYVHLAMTSMVGHIDLPVVTMRLMIPAVCALTAVLIAVVGWRLSGRRWVGIAAAAMFYVIGDFDFVSAAWPPFGTQVAFVIWPSLSMTFSWALLVALIGVVGEILRSPAGESTVPRLGRGAYVLVALLALASSATKASSLPAIGGGLALAFLIKVIATRRIPWNIAALATIVVGAQLFATAAIFAFQSYGVSITPLSNISWAWEQPDGGRDAAKQAVIIAAAIVAYLIHLQLRGAGIIPALWLRRGRLEAVQWFLLGGAITGPALHMTFSGYAASWFGRAGFPFSVLLSAWGFAWVFERARLSSKGKALLAIGALGFSLALIAFTWKFGANAYPTGRSYGSLIPMLKLAAILIATGVGGALLWHVAAKRLPGLRRRGGLVLLTAILVAGAPGLLMDVKLSWGVPGGPYGHKALIPASLAQAARWVRDHSEPGDIVATNSHCSRLKRECTSADSFWLSAYSERSILLEGWAFAPRTQAATDKRYWDDALLRLNEEAFYAPTAEKLRALKEQHGVRYLVAVRDVTPESAELRRLAHMVLDRGRVAVYELL